jgi:hypothetical protein
VAQCSAIATQADLISSTYSSRYRDLEKIPTP